jgi:hypothetical protein
LAVSPRHLGAVRDIPWPVTFDNRRELVPHGPFHRARNWRQTQSRRTQRFLRSLPLVAGCPSPGDYSPSRYRPDDIVFRVVEAAPTIFSVQADSERAALLLARAKSIVLLINCSRSAETRE